MQCQLLIAEDTRVADAEIVPLPPIKMGVLLIPITVSFANAVALPVTTFAVTVLDALAIALMVPVEPMRRSEPKMPVVLLMPVAVTGDELVTAWAEVTSVELATAEIVPTPPISMSARVMLVVVLFVVAVLSPVVVAVRDVLKASAKPVTVPLLPRNRSICCGMAEGLVLPL